MFSGSKTEIGHLLRICGYGVPDIDRVIQCATSSVNLIIQCQLRLYEESDGEPKLNEMYFTHHHGRKIFF